MVGRKRGRKRLILDIGSSAIRLCELSHTKDGYQLTKYYQRETLCEPSMDDAAKNELQTQALRDLLKEAKIRTKKTVFGVPGQSVFTRNRALPPVPEYKVTQIVRYEIQQQIPFALDQIALDYQVLGRTEAGGYDVMMAAIKVDVVEKRLNIIRDVKRRIDTVDVCPLAGYNWLRHAGEFGDQGECVALIDLGATTTDIVIERDNQFRFTRSLNVGGNDITAAISSAFGMSFLEAERAKRERGFAPTGDPQRDGKGGEVIGQALNRLVMEVTRSFAYFRSQPGGGPISRAIIMGGGACLRNIIPYLQRQLGVEVRIAQPLAGLAIAPTAQEVSEHPEQASTVLGLALRCHENVPLEINLVPPRVLESSRRKEQAFYWALSFVALALIVASTIPVKAAKDRIIQEQIDELRRVMLLYDSSIVPTGEPGDYTIGTSTSETMLSGEKASLKRLEDSITQLDAAAKKRRLWVPLINALFGAVPDGGGVYFSELQSGRLTLTPNTPMPADDAPAPELGRQVSVAGFPGIYGSMGMMGGGRGGMGARGGKGMAGGAGMRGRMMARKGGRGGAMGAKGAGQELTSKPPPEPNALIIQAFGKNIETVKRFIARMEEVPEFKYVYFNSAHTIKTPMETLYNAPPLPMMSGTGMGRMGGRMGGRGGGSGIMAKMRGRMGGKGKGSTGGAAGAAATPPGGLNLGPMVQPAPPGYPEQYTVVSFQIVAQFGEFAKPAAPAAGAKGATGAKGRRPSFMMRRMKGRPGFGPPGAADATADPAADATAATQ